MRRAAMTGITGLALLCAQSISAAEPPASIASPYIPQNTSPVRLEQPRSEQLKSILSEEALERMKKEEKDVRPADPPLESKTQAHKRGMNKPFNPSKEAGYNYELGIKCKPMMCAFIEAAQEEIESYLRRNPRTDRIPERLVMFNYWESVKYPDAQEFYFDGYASEKTGESLASRSSSALIVFFPGLERLGLSLEEQFDDVNEVITFNHKGEDKDLFQDASYGGKAKLSEDFLGARAKIYLRDGKKENRIDPKYMAREYRPRIDLEWYPNWGKLIQQDFTKGELTLNCRWPVWIEGSWFSIPHITGTYYFKDNDQGITINTNFHFHPN